MERCLRIPGLDTALKPAPELKVGAVLLDSGAAAEEREVEEAGEDMHDFGFGFERGCAGGEGVVDRDERVDSGGRKPGGGGCHSSAVCRGP